MTDGIFHRILFEADRGLCLDGAASAEGRFHHGGLRALYMSPREEWAWKAVEPYVRPGDPRRIAVALRLSGARLVDVRDPGLCLELGIDPADATVPWLTQLDRGERPASWRVADAAKAAGADGMIYASRATVERWHVVLFRWNMACGPSLTVV